MIKVTTPDNRQYIIPLSNDEVVLLCAQAWVLEDWDHLSHFALPLQPAQGKYALQGVISLVGAGWQDKLAELIGEVKVDSKVRRTAKAEISKRVEEIDILLGKDRTSRNSDLDLLLTYHVDGGYIGNCDDRTDDPATAAKSEYGDVTYRVALRQYRKDLVEAYYNIK